MARTEDTGYGEDYWATLDGGRGYQDSVMWEDIACLVKELVAYKHVEGASIDLALEMSALDVGCAYGYLVRHLRRRGLETWGIDGSEWAVAHAPEEIEPYIKLMDATDVAVPQRLGAERFDLITCIEVMEHIPESRVSYALCNIYDLLVSGGKAVFTICTDDRPGWDDDPTHVTIHPPDWWAKQLVHTGFRLLSDDVHFLRQHHLFYAHTGTFVVQRP